MDVHEKESILFLKDLSSKKKIGKNDEKKLQKYQKKLIQKIKKLKFFQVLIHTEDVEIIKAQIKMLQYKPKDISQYNIKQIAKEHGININFLTKKISHDNIDDNAIWWTCNIIMIGKYYYDR